MEVVLRPISIKDTSNIVKWRNDVGVKSNLFTQENINESQHLEYFHKYIETKKVVQFVIVANGIDCGTTFLKNIDSVNKKAEFGIFIGEPSFRGKGIGSIAVSKTIAIGFNELQLDTIYLTVFSENRSAIKSYEKSGFVIKKTGDKHLLTNGLYVEITEMEIRKERI